MRINHNISAINTNRLLGANNSAASKSLEKLSSGFRVNRAGDDAAGLAISEKMRGQIRGLDQASSNANDGISLIQTAEGALNETHSILQRMRELAVQSANDTNTVSDRTEIQKEIEQLTKEITRISTDTEFNTQKLLDGAMAAAATAKDADGAEIEGLVSVAAGSILENGDYDVTITVTKAAAEAEGGTPDKPASAEITNKVGVTSVDGSKFNGKADAEYEYKAGEAAKVGKAATGTMGNHNGGTASIDDGSKYTGKEDVTLVWQNVNWGKGASQPAGWYTKEDVERGATEDVTPVLATKTGTWEGVTFSGNPDHNDTVTFTAAEAAVPEREEGWYDGDGNYVGADLSSVGITYEGTAQVGDKISATAAAAGEKGEGETGPEYTVTAKDSDGNDVMASNFKFDEDALAKLLEENNITGKGDAFTITVTINDANAMTFHIGANSGQNTKLTIQDMGAKSLGVDAIDLTTQASADAAITTIDNAINIVSAQRAALGAMQNRLEHTINNLGASSENLSAAESQIRDVDMAEEMSEFTKNNILVQAATAMLAQANQQPQSVLSLLR